MKKIEKSYHHFLPLGVLILLVNFCLVLVECNAEVVQVDTKPDAVQVHFMDLKRSEFMEKLPNIKDVIASQLNEYCRDDAKNCDGYSKTRTNISGESITFFGTSDKERFHEEGRFVITNLNAKLTSLSDPNADAPFLPKEAMEDFFIKHRAEIVKDTSISIAYVNKKLVYPPRNNLDNWIIISVACTVTLFLIVFNLICQRKISKQAKEEFLKKAAELRPLLKTPGAINETAIVTSNGDSATVAAAAKTNALSRHDSFDRSFDQKASNTLGAGGAASSGGAGKRRKKSRSSSNSSIIAGNVGSGIGSPRNLTEPHDEHRQSNPNAISGSRSMGSELNSDAAAAARQQQRSRRHLNVSNHSINRHTSADEVQIPIHRVDSNFDRKNYQVETININEYPDPRVAYRLASNQN